MSQEIRQKANRDACAGLVRQAHQELTKVHQGTKEGLDAISHAIKLLEKAQKLAEQQPVPGSRRQPAQVRAKLARAATVLRKLEADIRAVPVTGLEKALATKRSRDGRKRAARILTTSVPTGPPVRILPTKTKRKARDEQA